MSTAISEQIQLLPLRFLKEVVMSLRVILSLSRCFLSTLLVTYLSETILPFQEAV
jgi:hypothetical protein